MIFQPLVLKLVKSFFEIISDAWILFQEIHQFLHFKKDSVFGFKRLVSVPFVLKFPKPLKCVFFFKRHTFFIFNFNAIIEKDFMDDVVSLFFEALPDISANRHPKSVLFSNDNFD